jgi:hypothetical protein
MFQLIQESTHGLGSTGLDSGAQCASRIQPFAACGLLFSSGEPFVPILDLPGTEIMFVF